MKIIVTKASDRCDEKIIELNSLEELKTYIENINVSCVDGMPRVIMGIPDADNDYENDISLVDMEMMIYDNYIE